VKFYLIHQDGVYILVYLFIGSLQIHNSSASKFEVLHVFVFVLKEKRGLCEV